jgi:exodeoxyribonuclease V gamma subunit
LRATAELRGALALAGKLPYRAVYEVLRDRLGGQTSSAPLSEGVVVGPLASLAELPFRATFVIGLGANRFLEGRSESPLDLRGSSPRPSDLFPDDRQRQAFFSAIFGTKERVVLSWVGRDERTGESIEPAAAVIELLGWMRDAAIGEPYHAEVRPERWEPVVRPEPAAPDVESPDAPAG